jgi:hypothetical protein
LASSLTGPGVSFQNGYGLWLGNHDTFFLLVRSGDPAPGFGPDVRFSGIPTLAPLINGRGQVAFWGGVTGPRISPIDRTGIWMGGVDDPLRLVLRFGDPAPGFDPGIVFRSDAVPSRIGINDAGEIAFLMDVAGPGINDNNKSGIWAGPPGQLQLVVRQGDPSETPGEFFRAFFTPIVNGAGEVAFSAYTSVAGEPRNDIGVWSTAFGGLHMVAQQGRPIPEGPGPPLFDVLGYPVMNAAGQVAFMEYFTGFSSGKVERRFLLREAT